MEYIKSFTGKWEFLSNFSKYPVWFDGYFYPTVENAFQAAKTLDLDYRQRFLEVSPGAAKAMGRAVPLRPDWNIYFRYRVMRDLLRNKFGPYSKTPDLPRKLVSTYPNMLVEGNYWHDNTWGVCYCGKCKEGMNLLGMELMRIRDKL